MEFDNTINNNFNNLSLNEDNYIQHDTNTEQSINDTGIQNTTTLIATIGALSLEDKEETLQHKSYDNETYYDYDTSIDSEDQAYNGDNEHEIEIEVEDSEINHDMYDTSPYICFGIPNIYCNDLNGDFDDEDFIFNRYDLPNSIKKYIKKNNSIAEYVTNFCLGNGILINYNEFFNSPEIIYVKILYIYQYIDNYYRNLKHLKPTERLSYLPDNLLYFIENIIIILKTIINENELKSQTLLSIDNLYFKELVYGLHIIITELSLLLNHYKFCKLWQLQDTHVKLFFKMVNNMCVIIIYMKLNNL